MKPWLLLPAKVAHDLAPYGLDVLMAVTTEVDADVKPFAWKRRSRTIKFRNPLGIAGGVDKNGTQIWGWRHFGAGFVEVGTVTPNPQKANSGKIIGRNVRQQALWNRMGFPGRGAEFTRGMIKEFRSNEYTQETASALARLPVFINIGKQRETELANASADYTWLIDFFSDKTHFERPAKGTEAGPDGLAPLIDAFVINISSPNTQGLRELFSRDRLYEFLGPIAQKLDLYDSPGLLKLSPDMDSETIASAVEVSIRLGLDGFIATNTTTARSAALRFPKEGGVSGAPLAPRSREMLKQLIEILGEDRKGRLIVSAGGVLGGAEAGLRLAMGADLVQTYSGLVFDGPRFFDHALRELVTTNIVR